MAVRTLKAIVHRLAAHYGEPPRPAPRSALEFILYENVAYLVTESRRAAAFARLKREVGTTARAIAKAPLAKLRTIVAAPGRLLTMKVQRLREIAALVMNEFDGDLDAACDGPPAEALRALQQFPAIGVPGAERVLLLTGRLPILAVDSNGLRVLTRIGYAHKLQSYARTYRAVRAAIAPEIGTDTTFVQRAHLLLQTHGRERCRSTPRCDGCPVRDLCDYGRQGTADVPPASSARKFTSRILNRSRCVTSRA